MVVVEDLLAAPGPLLQVAYAATFCAPAAPNYPGLRAPAPAAYAARLRATLLPVLRQVFAMEAWEFTSAVSDFSLVTCRPEHLNQRQRIPHTDASDSGLIALLHYLAPQGCGGTSFYRHRATGFESVGPERRALYEASLARDLLRHPPEGYANGDGPVFERIGGFDGRFNRLIAYRGALLHSGDMPRDFGFSTSPREGRLTLNTFFTLRPRAAPEDL